MQKSTDNKEKERGVWRGIIFIRKPNKGDLLIKSAVPSFLRQLADYIQSAAGGKMIIPGLQRKMDEAHKKMVSKNTAE